MRIGLNLLHAMPEIGGGWNYIARLVSALGGGEGDNTFVCFVTSKSSTLVPDKPNFKPVMVKINPSSRLQRVFYENTILQFSAIVHRLDLMHWFANTMSIVGSVPCVVTVHDLLYFVKPYQFPRMKRLYLRTMTAYAVKNAHLLLPVSQYTAQALRSVLNANNERMMVIPAIVDDSFKPVDNKKVIDFRRKYNLPEFFWLYVAHFYSHKNHRRLLEAYHGLIKQGFIPWPLVLRGDDHGELPEINKLICELGIGKDVIFLPRLEEGDLPILFSAASALVFPSLYEGGGIPVLEAMACGCPVAASSIPTMREFGGDAVLMFDPLIINSISDAMRKFQEDLPQRLLFRQRAFERVSYHRPEYIRKKLITSYKMILDVQHF